MEELTRQIEQQHALINQIRSEIGKVLIGQQQLVAVVLRPSRVLRVQSQGKPPGGPVAVDVHGQTSLAVATEVHLRGVDGPVGHAGERDLRALDRPQVTLALCRAVRDAVNVKNQSR